MEYHEDSKCTEPSCPRCFPTGQLSMRCIHKDCNWTGKRHECGFEELSDGVVDTCPLCGCDCEVVWYRVPKGTKCQKCNKVTLMSQNFCGYCGHGFEESK